MKVGDLVKHRKDNESGLPIFGIIVGNRGLSWRNEYRMWLVEWLDGTCEILHEYSLEVANENR